VLHQLQHQVAELVGRVYRPSDSLADLLAGLLRAAVRDACAKGGIICAPGFCDVSVGSGEEKIVAGQGVDGLESRPGFDHSLTMKGTLVANGHSPATDAANCSAPIVYQNQEIGCVSFAFDQQPRASAVGAEFLGSFAREIAFLVKRHDVGSYARQKLGIDAILIGSSRPLRRLEEGIEKVAQSDLPVLIEAEFGLRELDVAAAIHCCGPRKHRPFVAKHCAAQQAPTFLAELAASLGKARGGSLFLRFIDELDHALQKELLSLLGSLNSAERDVRIIASASRPLAELVTEGGFCRFLRTEIEVLKLEVPPLRHRREDIPLLLEHELRKHGCNPPKRFSAEALSGCQVYDWPENLLELERLIARLAVMTDGDCISIADLQQHLGWPAFETDAPVNGVRLSEEENDAPDLPPGAGIKFELSENACPPDQHMVELARNLIAGRCENLDKYGVGIQRALNYVARNFDHEISLTELAKQSFFSPSHLSFLFKKTLGVSFKGILTIVRIEKAKQLLAEKPNHSITEISLDAGFGDLSHFEKTFKRMTGLNPREFRRRKLAEMAGETSATYAGRAQKAGLNSIVENSAGKAFLPKSRAV
jgi:AraC-like DNA-binding protein